MTLNKQVLDALALKPMTAIELADRIGVPREKVINALGRLRNNGLVIGPGRGSSTSPWKIVGDGQPAPNAPPEPASERKIAPSGKEWSMRAKVGEAEIDVHGSPDFVQRSTAEFFKAILFMYGEA